MTVCEPIAVVRNLFEAIALRDVARGRGALGGLSG